LDQANENEPGDRCGRQTREEERHPIGCTGARLNDRLGVFE
jgi:hypothetical protein